MKTRTTKKLTAMKILKSAFLSAIALVMVQQTAQAQFEPQFTQYMFNEMFINPAYAGSRE